VAGLPSKEGRQHPGRLRRQDELNGIADPCRPLPPFAAVRHHHISPEPLRHSAHVGHPDCQGPLQGGEAEGLFSGQAADPSGRPHFRKEVERTDAGL
jgi:hypothetical protein